MGENKGNNVSWSRRNPFNNDNVTHMIIIEGVQNNDPKLMIKNQKLTHLQSDQQGLLRVTKEGTVDLLTDEAEKVKFRLTDGVDVARNGAIYFTDASYKYNLGEYILDHMEGRPHGRLMSFDPQTNLTQVLLHDLYFANGVALSPHHDFLVFCETPL